MTLPRRLVPGQTHSASRRTADRTLSLLPTKAATAIQLYALGRALEQNPGVSVFAYCTNTTHDHMCFTDLGDPEEPSPVARCMMMKNGLMARALNAHLGRGGSLFQAGSYSNVEVHDKAAVLDQYLYTMTNVVKDGHVATVDQWTGVKVLPEDFGRTFVVPRPESAFFGGRRPADWAPTDPDARDEWEAELRREDQEALQRAHDDDVRRGRSTERQKQLAEERIRRRKKEREEERGRPRRDRSTLPAFVTFTVGRPPGYDDWPLARVQQHFREQLDARTTAIHRAREASSKPDFVGPEALLERDPRTRLGEPFPRFKLNPRVACKDVDTRIEVLRGLVAWRKEMREKREEWADGDHDVVFPRGVYGMWKFHGARVAGLEDGPARGPPTGSTPPS